HHLPQISPPDLAEGDAVAAMAKGERLVAERAAREADARRPLFALPAEGILTSGYGARWGTTHWGIDIANSIGMPIVAAADGVVAEAGPASGFGLWVRILHADGTTTVYGHINRTLVEAGERVQAGEEIAEMGNRGHSTGPHLHFEVWNADSKKINPLAWLRKHGINL
ncbi:MAG: M23 family metallopeptidase, partial [Pseudonocardiaceae bacterium]